MGRYVVHKTGLFTGTIVVLTALMLPLFTAAQRPVQVRRIAFLGFGPPSAAAPDPFVEAFRQALHAHRWTEGHNLAIEWRWAEGSLDHFATLVTEVIGLQVEVIVVPNGTMAGIAKQATSTIPIVVVSGGSYASRSDLIASLARPGGNVTGLAGLGPEILPKRLQLLKEALPGVTWVAVLRGLESFTQELQAMEAAAPSLGVELHLFDVREPTAFDSAFAAMASAQAQALFVLGGRFLASYRQRIVDLAAQYRLPASCPGRQYVEAGCLMGYGSNQRDRGLKIATYVDKILHGAKPADLPVEQVMRFEFVINLKTAQTLGLTLPPMVLFQADEIIR